MKTIIPVILCGGSGTRLWPASRENHPKQFLSLIGDLSLLQNTALRAMRLARVKSSHVVAVTLGSLRHEVERQLDELDDQGNWHILTEPVARNTAAAVALAAVYVQKTFGKDTVMWVLPSDHHIGQEGTLGAAAADGLRAVENGMLVTFGIRPTRPETGYGYIRLGQESPNGLYYHSDSFVEKPDLATAQSYLNAGNYLWNSGMFMFGTEHIIDQFRLHARPVLDGVHKYLATAKEMQALAKTHYKNIPEEPFDKAIMEKSDRVAVIPCDPAWSDIGSWESLWEIRPKDKNGNVLAGRVACQDSRNCLIQAQDRLIGCVGLENIVVVEAGDAILIAERSNTDAMRRMVKALKDSGCEEVFEMPSIKKLPENDDMESTSIPPFLSVNLRNNRLAGH